ncbi:MAG: hypothetical protein CMO20_05095 [Thermoplasmata archaeon]|nr:hypothetical protein [Thermoplasmata archaeon]|tara:strand:+ start:284 stop:565 length:282 start_codon:yes stop_codon:yes gene_type:complete
MAGSVIGFESLANITYYSSYVGMGCILLAFVLETRGILNSRGLQYLLLMAVGSGILGIRAMHTGEWAFVVLEAAWMIASLMAIFKPMPTSNQM